MTWTDKMGAEDLLSLYDLGVLTRSELASALAAIPDLNIQDPELAKDVAALRDKTASGEAFKIESVC